MSYFSANQLTAGFNKTNVIENISFQLKKGSLMGILGANGSGKTTLIKAICGIIRHEGCCTFEDITFEKLTEKQLSKIISYIPQRSGISIDISVLDVVLMGFNPKLKLLEHPDASMKERAIQALKLVGLQDKEQINYMNLSEGQKQLCILARTLVSDSKLFLLDEPESALDFRFRYKMLDLLKNRVKSDNCSAIVTLHDPILALNFCDSLLLLSDGGISGIIKPQEDSLEDMEEKLSSIYGKVSLQKCFTKNKVSQIVMLREEEE